MKRMRSSMIFYLGFSITAIAMIFMVVAVSGLMSYYILLATYLGCLLLFPIGSPLLVLNKRLGLVMGLIGCILELIAFSSILYTGIREYNILADAETYLFLSPYCFPVFIIWLIYRDFSSKEITPIVFKSTKLKVLLFIFPIILSVVYIAYAWGSFT